MLQRSYSWVWPRTGPKKASRPRWGGGGKSRLCPLRVSSGICYSIWLQKCAIDDAPSLHNLEILTDNSRPVLVVWGAFQLLKVRVFDGQSGRRGSKGRTDGRWHGRTSRGDWLTSNRGWLARHRQGCAGHIGLTLNALSGVEGCVMIDQSQVGLITSWTLTGKLCLRTSTSQLRVDLQCQ